MKEKMKRLLILSLAVLMILTSIPLTGFVGLDIGFTAEAALATEGKCGDNASWKYDAKTKTLTVSGTGKMWDYTTHEPEYMADPETDIQNVVIEKGITRIGDFSFDIECIKKITIPDTVEEIGYCAFSSTSITSLNLPEGLKVIETEAFAVCEKLKKVTLPSTMEEVGENAFSYCDALTSFNTGSGNVRIATTAIQECSKLKTVTIGKNTEFYGAYFANSAAAFSANKSNPYYSTDENGVLYNKDKTVLLAYPALSKATVFTVPDTVKKISILAFTFAEYIETVKMTSVEEIEEFAFCTTAIKNLDLGTNIKKIAVNAFMDNESLKEITIPASVEEYGIDTVDNRCKFTVDKNNKFYSSENGSFFNKDKTVMYTYYVGNKQESYKVPSTVEEIYDCAFMGASELKKVTLPSSLKKIGFSAFCETGLTSVTIPKNVEEIGEYAFEYSKLKKLVIEDGCKTSIGDSAFYSCENLKEITIPDSIVKCDESAFDGTAYLAEIEENYYSGPVYIGNILYNYFDDYSTILNFKIKEGTTIICSSGIPRGAVSVKIPASVQYIEEGAFAYMENLASINLDSKNKNFVFEDNTLYTKDKTRIIIYMNSPLKTSYTVPDTVTEIDYGAFDKATSLNKINFGKMDLNKLNLNQFSETKWYKSLPVNEVLYINDTAVGMAEKYIYAVNVKDGTKKISDNFASSVWSDAVCIPESVEYIGSIPSVDVYYEGTREQWDKIAKSKDVQSEERFMNLTCDFDKNNHEHIFYGNVTKENSCLSEGEVIYACPCGEIKTEVLPKIHHYSTYYTYEKPASLKATGKKVLYCDMCGKKLLTKTTPKIASISLKKTKFTYTGEYFEFDVIVKDANGESTYVGYYVDCATDYTSVGKHKVTIKLDDYVYSGSKDFTIEVLPGKTSKITSTESDSAVKLTWNKVKGATGYRVYLYNTKTKKYEKAGDTTGTSYTVKKLKSGTTYKLAVKAYTKVGKKVYWASSYTEITTATKPAAPAVKTKAGSKKVTLSWEKVRGATGYQIYMMNSEGKFEKIATTKELKYVKTGLKKGSTYSFRVRAYKKLDSKTLYSSYKTYTVKAK